MTVTKGISGAGFDTDSLRQAEAEMIASEFEAHMNEFHSFNVQDSDDVMLYWHQCFTDVLKRGVQKPPKGTSFIRPSIIGSDPQQIYWYLKREKDDTGKLPQDPRLTRWQAIGTVVGDMWQKQVLHYEKFYEKVTGKPKAFKFERNERNEYYEPMFEEFARKWTSFVHNGKTYYLYGTTDGIMLYKDYQTGKVLRVGLEIKSKQTSYSATSRWTMRQSQEKHRKQVTTYSLMYGVDYWIILYQNCSKKGWRYTKEDTQKYPDFRVFGIYVTDTMKENLMSEIESYYDSLEGDKPKLDLMSWEFNNYKIKCIQEMTEQELYELGREYHEEISVDPSLKSFEVKTAFEALDEIQRLWSEHHG
ncbi:hypothetical protein COE80_19405 [Bacillus pseudomycoides]|uniref:hypothetical protein n=1 Tax=Bacillus pseudomycoides TaxID=64104 RepID=UPI000BFBCB7B|nr:hypothetical protein [Bacillus pseudomycoides]PHB23081.1 hypothetical protein COE80_19405 [Bacillus pseudomycoides]PHE37610.1 hypothetical protein COF51_16370 [Bacillus pseudomycoides]